AIGKLEPRVRLIVDDLIKNAADAQEFDLVSDIAFPLAAAVICDLLGVPRSDIGRVREWSTMCSRLVEPFVTPQKLPLAERVLQTFLDYFTDLVEQRRRQPGDELLSSLIAAEEQGDRLTTHELLVTAALIIGASIETIENLLGTAVLTLLRYPDQLVRLRDDPQLLTSAVEEFLRYESPVQMSTR